MTRIRGAVLERVGDAEPWSKSTPITVDVLELDDPGPGEVEVRMEAAGVCHSDLSRVNGNREVVVPMLLGHEGSGTVVRCGPDTDGVAVGDRVVMTFLPICGTCEACTSPGWALCSRGSAANARGEMLGGGRRLRRRGGHIDHHGGVSSFATRAIVDIASLVVVPPEVPADVAAVLGCAVLTGGGAVLNAGGLKPGESVAVVGLGGVGFAAMMIAASAEPSAVLAVDVLPGKLTRAGGFGATRSLTPQDAVAADARYDLVVECTGNLRALETAIALTRPGGRTVTVGLPHPSTQLTISPLSLVTEARSLIGSYLGSGDPAEDIRRYAALYLEGRLPLDKLITGHIALADINKAMDDLHAGSVLRQIIDLANEQEPA
ncbi:alcohol dehydrogenase catalytic domain-containing protein [Streptomyces sp. NPDC047042]|jgi:alcohol dehydrogenase|uniref:alcohol dehydrogenase catalytic domain-containing protein n=1 Tax=unclassified Streptomyces TaxID=2593676 RepID=UPI0033D338F2